MQFLTLCRAVLAVALLALAVTGGAAAVDEEARGIDPNQGRSLVEVTVPDKAAAIRLQLAAESYGIDFNEHYLRNELERDGHRHRLRRRGRAAGARRRRLQPRHDDRGAGHVGGPAQGSAGRRRGRGDRRRGRARRGRRRGGAARRHRRPPGRLLRELRGRFLSVEAKDGTRGSSTTGESLVVGWNTADGHGDRPGPADDEREHRPGHDAGHVHRAPHPREGRRGRHLDPAGADADPDRLEQRHVRRGWRAIRGSAAACRR